MIDPLLIVVALFLAYRLGRIRGGARITPPEFAASRRALKRQRRDLRAVLPHRKWL